MICIDNIYFNSTSNLNTTFDKFKTNNYVGFDYDRVLFNNKNSAPYNDSKPSIRH